MRIGQQWAPSTGKKRKYDPPERQSKRCKLNNNLNRAWSVQEGFDRYGYIDEEYMGVLQDLLDLRLG
ncbi:hypothetical protein LTR85_002560 [Meristemomyces frigidus]|nr:hypothetical protein LTR85_002560 [Meristemomyces frigidus]